MKDFLETLQALQKTPVPNLVVIAGFILLLLAFVGRIGAIIELPRERQKWAGIVGALLLIFGIGLFTVPGSQPDSTSLDIAVITPDTPTVTLTPPATTPVPPSDTSTPKTPTNTPMATATATNTSIHTPTLSPTPTNTPSPTTPPPTSAPVCPPANAKGTIPPAIAISSITFVVNGVEQIVNGANSLNASSGDQVQVKEVIICSTEFFEGDGGNVSVAFTPVENGPTNNEYRETRGTKISPDFMSIPGPDDPWTIGNWQQITVVTIHSPLGGTEDQTCGAGECERDDRMIVLIE